MSRIQISKIQHRSGNIADLPTLDEAELGYATDAKRLFIGSGVEGGNVNIEIFTAQSNNVTVNTVTASSITTGSVSTLGTMTGQWALTSGSVWVLRDGATLKSFTADIAECYSTDSDYEPGTVLEFGGEYEVTLAEDETTRVAGIVTTNPAYVLNSMIKSDNIIAIALVGRVPCKVRGNIKKGDMLISGGDGYARPTHNPKIGTIIGKALEDFSGTAGVIEVAVARH